MYLRYTYMSKKKKICKVNREPKYEMSHSHKQN